MLHKKAAGFALALGLSLGGAAPENMRVEEPAMAAVLPVDPEKEAGQWKDKPALTPQELAADRERRRKMEEMVRVIQEKRKALQLAGQNKPQRAQELQELIFSDPGKSGEKADRAIAKLERRQEASQRQLEKKSEKEKQKKEKEKNKKPGKGG